MHDQNNSMPGTLADRIATITRSIASGNNACGSLIDRDGRVNGAFLALSIQPTLEIYEREAAELRQQRDELLRDIEAKRAALESAVANIPAITGNPSVLAAFRAALPGHPFLN